MPWPVLFHVAFVEEFQNFPQPIQDEIAAMAELLLVIGPTLKRPHADTLKG
jgi:hypothetical protein